MTKVTCDMAMSVDGFVAGPNQSLEHPFGEGVDGRLHRWMFEAPEANAAALEGILFMARSEPPAGSLHASLKFDVAERP